MKDSKGFAHRGGGEDIVMVFEQEAAFEWFRRYGTSSHCPACGSPPRQRAAHKHNPACPYIAWRNKTYPQYGLRSGRRRWRDQ